MRQIYYEEIIMFLHLHILVDTFIQQNLLCIVYTFLLFTAFPLVSNTTVSAML